jgi:hypothetical protein
MGKKKNDDADDHQGARGVAEPANESHEPGLRRRSLLPALSVGDILALVALIVLSAALLLEGYHKEFKDYSKEIVALFAVVVGFLLGRKT